MTAWEDRYRLAVKRAEGAERERDELRRRLTAVREQLQVGLSVRHVVFRGWCYNLIARAVELTKGG